MLFIKELVAGTGLTPARLVHVIDSTKALSSQNSMLHRGQKKQPKLEQTYYDQENESGTNFYLLARASGNKRMRDAELGFFCVVAFN